MSKRKTLILSVHSAQSLWELNINFHKKIKQFFNCFIHYFFYIIVFIFFFVFFFYFQYQSSGVLWSSWFQKWITHPYMVIRALLVQFLCFPFPYKGKPLFFSFWRVFFVSITVPLKFETHFYSRFNVMEVLFTCFLLYYELRFKIM